ncbi:Acetyltransferase (GNAT) family protein [Pseudarcicella hirudinis]|uniref:Acetyltransferase (GNAT) family protein n=2 Tax=Pseudarcicella hirudinis TaxID=1079859 RepID=A0A1I5UZ24_9BACT|nr:GNAT family N-acetyltransferase [Pseudarcicella hirudinis]SFQ00525.1 Acetyltransferase (GNAT) family protein [Pseudarcicella hirudinis]
MSLSPQIIKVDSNENHLLSQLCNRIYRQHFPYLWDEGGLEWYTQKVYAPEVLKLEIEHPNTDFFFMKMGNEPVGYIKLNYTFGKDPEGMEVERIYFLEEFAGQGLGKKMILFAFDSARSLGKSCIYLKVMDSSANSIAFYQKTGFEIISNFRLDDEFRLMKSELRGMHLMKKTL